MLIDLALILFATKVLSLLTRKIHLPQIIGALLAGVILGPALLGIIVPNEIINIIAELGVLLLLFEAGLETDFNQLRKSLKPMMLIAILGVILSLAGGFALAYCFGYHIIGSIFVGVILTSSSISITVEALNEMGKLKSKTGTIIMGALVVEDIFSVIIFSVVLGMGGGSISVTQIGITLLMIVVFFIFAVVCGLAAFKAFEYLSVKWGMTRRVSVFGVAFCFFMSYAADWFGLANIIGAYIAGLVLCNNRAEKYIEAKSNVISFLFFSPVFFVSIGLKMSFNGLSRGDIIFAALFIAVALSSKIIGCGLGAKICKYNIRESVQVGAGMAARCEFPVVAAVIGMNMGLVDMKLFSIVIIMVIVTTFFSPILLKLVFRNKSKP